MANASDGMNYAPKGKAKPVVKPGEFVFSVLALEHGHIYGMCNGLTEAGATLKYVYDKDPNKFADAVKYDQVTFKEVINRDLKVMDSTAFSLCKDNDMSILVFNLDDPENVVRAVSGEKIGTLVSNEER